MATSRSLGQLTIDLIARTAGFTEGMDRASRSARKTGRDIEGGLSKSIDRAVGSLRTLAGIAGVGFSVQQVVRYTDAFTGLQNRLRLVTDTQAELAKATNDLFDISLRTAQSIDSTAQVYQRFAQNADRLGLSLQDIADVTDTVTKAVAISGASAASAEAALVQFGQAIASGVLRGQELNSVMEQTPGLAMAIAEGLGVTIGELRALAAEGKITADALIQALRNSAQSVDEQFSTRVLTLGQGFTNLQTSIIEYVGRLDTALGGTNSLAEAIDNVAQAISRASRSMDDLGKEVDAVKELISILDEFSTTFLDGFRDQSGDVAQYFQTSFRDSFLATAKELDALWDAFDGAALALEAIFKTLGDNIRIFFSNAFNKIREDFSLLIFNITEGLNSTFGTNIQSSLWVGPGVESFKSLSDAAKDAFAEGGKTVSLYNQLLGRLDLRALEDSFDVDLTGDFGASGGGKGGGGGGEKSTKNKISEGERYIESLKKQLETVAKLTEVETLRNRMAEGSLTFATRALEDQAIAYAQTIDFIKEQEEAYKLLEESRKEFAAGLADAPAFGGIDALIGGASGELIKTGEAAEELQEWYDEQLAAQLEFLEQGVINEQEYADRIYEINKTNDERLASLNASSRSATLSLFADMTGQTAELLETMGKRGSAAYKVLFFASKAAAIAQAIVNTEEAATKALTLGPILGIPASTLIRVTGYASVATMAATTIAGMAHDGIDSVPEDGTWLLQRGERVTTAETSAKLDSTLERLNNDMGRSRGNGTVVNLIESRDRAGEVETRYDDEQEVIDVFVADIRGGGRASQAMERTYGLARVGR